MCEVLTILAGLACLGLHDETIFLNKNVRFYLNTQVNPIVPQKLIIDNVDSIKNSFFDWRNPTKFIVCGWFVQPELTTILKDAYFSVGPHNIILVDWTRSSLKLLWNTIDDIPRTGQQIAEFIDFMTKWGFLKPENLTLIGHSLGGHIVGHAGRSLKSGQLQTIIGLDPFRFVKRNNRGDLSLMASDALYVESIQTNAGLLGFMEPIGKATFYPNGGMQQEYCTTDIVGLCSHFKSFRLFAEAIRNNGFPSIRCNDYKEALENRCGQDYSPTVRMGAPSNVYFAEGVFYVPMPDHPYKAFNPLAGLMHLLKWQRTAEKIKFQ